MDFCYCTKGWKRESSNGPGRRISELTASVGEQHLKEPLESFAPKCLIEPVEYICYRPSCVGIAYECKHEFAVPEIEAFLDWADKQVVTGNSKFAKALTYLKNRRNDLMTYLEDGHCSLSNNWSENSIRPVTVGRKNWRLFSSS